MAGVNKFLESVSIGGLSHISNAGGKYARLFWLVIVLFGNILAGLIIFESFVDWAKNPIRTTIKTKPITELKFPNVTVCPPHNTFTDLNYDLMMVGNKTLSKEKIEIDIQAIIKSLLKTFPTWILEFIYVKFSQLS